MGNTKSTTSSQVVSNAIAKAVTENISECSAGASLEQTVDLSGFNLFSSYKQSGVLTASCLQKNSSDQSIVQDIANKIAQEAAATSTTLIGVSLGDTSANAVSRITSNLNVAAIDKSMQECAASLNMKQAVTTSGATIGVTVQQGAELYSKCLQENRNTKNIAQSVVTDVNQKVEATTEDLLSSLFGEIGKYIAIAIIVFVAIIILAIVVKIISSRRQRQSDEMMQQMMMQQMMQQSQPRQPYQQSYQQPPQYGVPAYQPPPPTPYSVPSTPPMSLQPHPAGQDFKNISGTQATYKMSTNEVFTPSTGRWVSYPDYTRSTQQIL